MKKLIILTIILFTVQFLAPIFGQTEQKPRLVVQTGHTYWVESVAFSPDGKMIASGGSDKTIKLWDALTGKELFTLAGHGSSVSAIAFSPNGKILASADEYDKNIKFWDTITGKEILSVTDELDEINTIAFSSKGEFLAAGGEKDDKGVIKIWELQTGEKLKLIPYFSSVADASVMSVAFSPNRNLLVSGNLDGVIKLLNLDSKKDIKVFEGHTDEVTSVAFSPNGKSFLSGSADKSINLWDITSGQILKTFTGHQDVVWSVVFSPDGKTFASTSSERGIILWDVDSGQKLKILSGYFIHPVIFSPKGENLVSGDAYGIIKIWDVNSGSEIKTLKGLSKGIMSLTISSDGQLIIIETTEKKIKLLKFFSEQSVKTIDDIHGPAFSLSPDKKRIALVKWLKKPLPSGIFVDRIITLNNAENQEEIFSLNGHNDSVINTKFSPNSTTLASRSADGTIKLWDVESGQLLQTLFIEKITKIVQAIEFSPNGKMIASGFKSGKKDNIILWDVKTGQLLKTFSGHDGDDLSTIKALAFSSDNKLLASVSSYNTIKLWDIETGKDLKTLNGQTHFAQSIAFSTDNKKLASIGSIDRLVRVWDIDTGEIFKTVSQDDPTYVLMISAIVPTIYQNNKHELIIKDLKYYINDEGSNGKVNLHQVETGKLLASIIVLGENDWIITTPDGRFDTNKLENPQGLHWIMPDAPFTPLSFEVFMRDYYEPNLLPRLLKCTEENNCEQEFKPVRNLTELNRTQPKVKISSIKPIDSSDEVEVKVEAEDVVSEFQRNKQNKPLHSGIFDLRLFRDGQLVGYSTADEKLQNTFRTYANFDEELKVWQEANKVELVNGKKTFTFRVQLPKNRDAKEFKLRNQDEKEFEFSAYAFNVDRVKSETARETYKSEKPLPMAKGNAYIVTIGVNANETGSLRLNYAANDARRLPEELAKNLPKDRYKEIVQIQLISDFDKDGKLSENNATKAKIKAVLDRLAGNKTVADDLLKDVPNAASLKKVQPEDLVLIAFSGHGYADQAGIFYLIPYDIGKIGSGGLAGALQKSISSDELSLWLRDIDAGEMMMIVDACHSAAAVQGKDFKPGPMGSRGLGQLSYDKGMRILTATQANDVAFEIGQTKDGKKIEGGLLTYSLVTNGIVEKLADFQPKDDKLFSNEWLSFAVKDVPDLYGKIARGEIKDLLINGVKPKGTEVIYLDGTKSNLNLQQPSLFDFGKRERQYELLNILKNGGNE